MMDARPLIVRMITQLLKDMQTIQHQGSGYYTCKPFATRYNKLLAQAQKLFPGDESLITTFEPFPEDDPKDPADKMKVLQSIHIESDQLITLLEAVSEGQTPPKEGAEQ